LADRWKNKTWKEKKQVSKFVAIIGVGFFCVSLLTSSRHKKEDITYKTIILSGKPKFKRIARNKSITFSSYLELPTKEKKYKLDGADYKYLTNRLEFRTNVKSGTELIIGLIDDEVLTLSRNNIQYTQFEKAQFHKGQKRLFTIGLFSPAVLICIISLFFKERPKIKLKDGSYQGVSFGAIIFLVSLLNFILLIFIIGYDFIVASEFID